MDDDLFAMGAPARLQAADPELYTWHLEQLHHPPSVPPAVLHLAPDAQAALSAFLEALPGGREAEALRAFTGALRVL